MDERTWGGGTEERRLHPVALNVLLCTSYVLRFQLKNLRLCVTHKTGRENHSNVTRVSLVGEKHSAIIHLVSLQVTDPLGSLLLQSRSHLRLHVSSEHYLVIILPAGCQMQPVWLQNSAPIL